LLSSDAQITTVVVVPLILRLAFAHVVSACHTTEQGKLFLLLMCTHQKIGTEKPICCSDYPMKKGCQSQPFIFVD